MFSETAIPGLVSIVRAGFRAFFWVPWVPNNTVDGPAKSCTLDGWNPINNGMFTTYQLVFRISLAHPPYHEFVQILSFFVRTSINHVVDGFKLNEHNDAGDILW